MRSSARSAVLALAALLWCASACTPKVDATCEGALREWLSAMDASENDLRRLKEAFVLLGPETRAAMEKRATKKSARLGRRIQAYELFTEGRLERSFEPIRFQENRTGPTATLRVFGPQKKEAVVRCVYEDGRARIELDGLEDPKTP